MGIRTDLAVDIFETLPQKNMAKAQTKKGGVRITTIKIKTAEEEEAFQKPKGTYITVEFPSLLQITENREIEDALVEALRELKSENEGTVLVAGLGNTEITADAIGPKTASRVLATRHIGGAFAKEIGLKGLKSVAVMAPGVLGKTGIETGELIGGAVKTVNPAAVIAIDALASGSVHRLFQTVQLCDSGISPGSGVKNSRKEISLNTLGVPVIAVGVPTVMDAGILAEELSGSKGRLKTDLVVTPKDADLLCERISELLANALNAYLQPELDREIWQALL